MHGHIKPVTMWVQCTAAVTVTSGIGTNGTWFPFAFWYCCKVQKGNTPMEEEKRRFHLVPWWLQWLLFPFTVEGAAKQPVTMIHLSSHADSWPSCMSSTEQPGSGLSSSKGWKEVTLPSPLPLLFGPQPKSRVSTGILIAAFLLVQKALGLEALCKGCEDHTETIPDKKDIFTPAVWNVIRSCLPWIKEFSS